MGRTPLPIVKIADFGIAKQTIGGPGGLIAAGVLMGSPAYLAPEQITGDAVAPATDLYCSNATWVCACWRATVNGPRPGEPAVGANVIKSSGSGR